MKIKDIQKWRIEIDLAEKFKEDEFGTLTHNEKTKAGENIDYFEKGFSDRYFHQREDMLTTVNIIDALASIIVPSLSFKNPRTVAIPKKIESEDSAPLVSKTIDHYRGESEALEVNQKVAWDAYVLGYGVYKVGYATKFGRDVPDEQKQKERKSAIDRGLEAIGLKKKEKEEVIRPEEDLRIVAESPFVEYVNPFDFGVDPRANSINDARFVYHKLRKTVKSMKENPKYKNTELLKGMEPDIRTLDFSKVSESELDDFKTVNLFEIHYRSQDKMYMLVITQDGSDEWREHYHEESIYDLGEWQFDMLTFKGHGHSLYPRSDITKIKNLQDRITNTIDMILEQVDKYVPKLAYSSGDLTEHGKRALQTGGVGALVECNKNPKEIFEELNFTQLKADLQSLIDQLISLISIQTGLTRAQLTGLSDARTATEASIEQGGQTIRLSDMTSKYQRFINRQSNKLWKVIRQFTPLEDLQLINGIRGVDEVTGLPKYDWLTLDSQQVDRVQEGDFDFDIEVGSTQKIDLATIRKSFENLFNVLARTEVIALMQQQGDIVKLAELLRPYVESFPEIGIDVGKIIQKIQPNAGGAIDPAFTQGRGGETTGSQQNRLASQLNEAVPTPGANLQEVSQI